MVSNSNIVWLSISDRQSLLYEYVDKNKLKLSKFQCRSLIGKYF